jgi:hypothetical protein
VEQRGANGCGNRLDEGLNDYAFPLHVKCSLADKAMLPSLLLLFQYFCGNCDTLAAAS